MKNNFLAAVALLTAGSLVACKREDIQQTVVITRVTPGTTVLGGSALNAAVIGDTLSIEGQNFSAVAADNRVSIHATPLAVLAASATELRAIVPPGIPFSYSDVTVVRDGYAPAVSAISIRSRPSPSITGIRPTRGPVGTVVTILGHNLTETYDNNIIAFPDAQGREAGLIVRPFQPVLATADSIRVVVPAGAGPGRVLLYGRPAETDPNTLFSLVTPPFSVTP